MEEACRDAMKERPYAPVKRGEMKAVCLLGADGRGARKMSRLAARERGVML